MLHLAEVLPNLLARRAAATPRRVYARHVLGVSWTYADLDEVVLRWAATLRLAGVERGDRVVVMLPNVLESIAVWLAVARLGAIEVPVNTGYRGRFLTHVANNAGARTAVVALEFLARFRDVERELESLEQLVVLGEASGDAGGRLRLLRPPGADDAPATSDSLYEPLASDIATILYTSGTTGVSKGVLVPWEQVDWTASACPPYEGRGEEDVFYSPFPQFHMSGKLAVCAAAV